MRCRWRGGVNLELLISCSSLLPRRNDHVRVQSQKLYRKLKPSRSSKSKLTSACLPQSNFRAGIACGLSPPFRIDRLAVANVTSIKPGAWYRERRIVYKIHGIASLDRITQSPAAVISVCKHHYKYILKKWILEESSRTYINLTLKDVD